MNLCLTFILLIVITLWATIVQIKQYESGVTLQLGKFHAMLNPGWNFVLPLITLVTKIDHRVRFLDFPSRSFETKDSKSIDLAATLSYHVVDAKKLVCDNGIGISLPMEQVNNLLSGLVEKSIKNFVANKDKFALQPFYNFDDSEIFEDLFLKANNAGIHIFNIELLQLENKREFEDKKQAIQELESRVMPSSNSQYPEILGGHYLKDDEWGIHLKLGKFYEILEPNWASRFWGNITRSRFSYHSSVLPFYLSKVHVLDKKSQILEIPKQEVITKDMTRTNLEAKISYKIKDPKKACLAVESYRAAIIHLVHSSIRKHASQISLYDLTNNQKGLNKILRKELKPYGIDIDYSKTEIKEVGSSYFVNTTFDKELPLNALKEERMELIRFHNESIAFGSGFWNLLRNLFTQRSLRLYLGLGFFGLASSNLRKSSSTLYALFTFFYLTISIIWATALVWVNILVSNIEYDNALQAARDVGGSIEPNYYFYTIAYGLCIQYLFLYLPVLFFLHWPHIYWTKKEFEKSLTDKANQISAVTEEVAKSASISGTLKDLYTLRSDVLKFQEEGMIIGELMNEIEVLENKFVNEAKQNISIEEIAKLQEEFIIGLSPENTL